MSWRMFESEFLARAVSCIYKFSVSSIFLLNVVAHMMVTHGAYFPVGFAPRPIIRPVLKGVGPSSSRRLNGNVVGHRAA